jgi:voltage-gated potassium channel
VVFVVGTIGYMLIGGAEHSLLDAVYMTVITLTTVGYEEAIAVGSRPVAQVFTMVLLLTGVGTFLYFFSSLTAFVVEGTIDHMFWRRRMSRHIDRLRDHFVVCGAGKTGEYVIRELIATNRDFVLIDMSEERVRDLHQELGVEFAAVVGDATEDAVLAAAGVERARGLIACTEGDKDNILTTFTARSINHRVRIVARCTDVAIEAKLARAGANAVVSPDRIGGLRLISEMVRPAAASFLDVMLRDSEGRWRVEEVRVEEGSDLDGAAVGALRKTRDLMVLAVAADGSWRYNPEDDFSLRSGMEVVFMCGPDAREALEKAAAPPGR